MKRQIIIALLASAILASCSKDETPAPASPTSYLVVTVLDVTAGNFKLVKYNTDGTGEAAFITSRFALGNAYAVPSVSPKGKKVVYTEGPALKMMDVSTAAVTNIYTHSNTLIGCPSFSPDETKIVFSASPAGEDMADLYIANAIANTTPVKITSNEHDYMAFYPRFSPDGSKLTFVNGHEYNGGIYVSDLQGNNRVRISEDHQAGDEDLYPVFTPDGTKVIYSSSKYGQNHDTYDLLMSSTTEGAEGTTARMFDVTTMGLTMSNFPVVSPDGLYIYFIGIDDLTDAQSIYKVSVTGGNPVKLNTVFTGTTQMVANLAFVKE